MNVFCYCNLQVATQAEVINNNCFLLLGKIYLFIDKQIVKKGKLRITKRILNFRLNYVMISKGFLLRYKEKGNMCIMLSIDSVLCIKKFFKKISKKLMFKGIFNEK